ncbi:efflux RND transporter periplasmic adaptor subunit [Mangrovibacterium marinum]|uniref:RND family efflux transporter MFP subunit n=1 Tax=Mangrovibacterium marinum TaxID=1639118 RepID=A0A2T5C6K5_9BACT|nr:efflux RND transporter periplasmic adaptor subunit [Mangrovibacterium marinum]PTN10578.1 RND family efflux transporter MFP subunit [Mangrovibacterium marinum]
MYHTTKLKQSWRQLLISLLTVLLVSCSTGNASNDDIQAKQTQLAEYKQQLHDLQQKIHELEDELSEHIQVERIDVVLSELKEQKFEHFFEVTGSVDADKEINVSPEGAGQILAIKVKEGQRVAKGTTLAVLNAEPINRSIEQTKINLELAKTTFERQKNLWDQNIGSELQYLQAKSNKESLEKQLENLQAQKDMSIIKAPVDGMIDVIYQKQGQIAGPQIPFAKLINIDNIKIYADVAESYLTKMNEGDEVSVYFPAINAERTTKIRLIGNYIDPNNRTIRVRLDLANPDKMIKPNMEAIVKIRDYEVDSAIVIPSLLIKEDFKGHYTYIAEGSGESMIAKKVYVTPGISDNNMTEVTAGLTAGTQVISEGFSLVFDGSPIRQN